MSYCVNCGVELDKTCQRCPLCQTPVLNPNQPIDLESPPPYPAKKGTAETDPRKEFKILISIILLTTAVVCLLLNLTLVKRGAWSVYVIGPCALLWVFLIPFFFSKKLPASASLLLDGIAIAVYLNCLSNLHPGRGWYEDIALPVTALATACVVLFYLFSHYRQRSVISRTAWILGSLAIICVSVELLARHHYAQPLHLSWSAIVLICCISIDLVLIAIYFMKGLREEFRKRLHF